MLRALTILLVIAAFISAPTAKAQTTWFYYTSSELVQENGDEFGKVLASGDFNGDGRGDVVVGTPAKNLDGVISAGVVHVRYGDGALPDQVLRPEISGWPLEQGLGFGTALLAMRLTPSDVADDLIIGVPGASVNGTTVGAIEIWSGGPAGLSFSTRWFQDESPPQEGARFGASLAAHDNKLFIGAPRAIVDDVAAGAVYYATVDPGFGFCVNGRIDQSSPGIPGNSEAGDGWASALAARDAGGGTQLLVGAPFEDIGSVVDAGAAWDLFVTTSTTCSGPPAEAFSATLYYQGDGAVPGAAETNDQFGAAVGYSRFGPGATVDLVIGVPREDQEPGGFGDTGCVHIFNGTSPSSCFFAGELHGDLETKSGQLTGSAIAAGRDWNLDGYEDLIVGIPGDDGDFARAGAVTVLNGSVIGPVEGWVLDLGQNAETFGNYGASVAFVGTFQEGLTQLDILIGEPGWDDPIDEIDRAGRATQTFLPNGMIFGDRFESGDLSAWDTAVP